MAATMASLGGYASPRAQELSSSGEGYDLMAQLRRQLTQATSIKESTKIELESLRRTVEQHLSRLNHLGSGGGFTRDRLSESVKAFDLDLQGRLAIDSAEADANSEGTYDVLRGALSDSQRRCQILNTDMLRVADANDELMGTLKTLKGTNKRLVEEVQKQTEELSTLTEQRILDQENLTRLEDAFRHEQVLWQQEAQRAIQETTDRADQELEKLRSKLMGQLEEFTLNAQEVARQTAELQSLSAQTKTETQNCRSTMTENMKRTERDMREAVALMMKRFADELHRLKDQEHHLQVKLRSEKEARENEIESWRSRYSQLQIEHDERKQTNDREISQLQAKAESFNSTREVEANTAQAERERLSEKVETLLRETAQLEIAVQTAKRQQECHERKSNDREAERARLTATVDSLKVQIRESDDALGEAVRNNEALREQMEVQRLDAHTANERDLKLCREMFEKRIETLHNSIAGERGDFHKKMRSLEEAIGLGAGDIESAREAHIEGTQRRNALQRDAMMWKAQHELASKMMFDVENEMTRFREDVARVDERQLQESLEDCSQKKTRLLAQRDGIRADYEQAQRVYKAREANSAERSQVLTALQKESSAELQQVRASLAEADKGIAAVKHEAAAQDQKGSELRASLQQDIARVSHELETERRELDRQLQDEQKHAQKSIGDFERLKGETEMSFRLANDGPSQHLAALEASAQDIQRRSEQELTSLRRQLERCQERAGELEVDLAREQARLAQTEQEVHDSTQRLNVAKTQNRTFREALERERIQKSEDLRSAQQRAAQKADRVKATARSGEEVRKRMVKEIEDKKRETSKALEEAEAKAKTFKAEYASAIEGKEADHRMGGFQIRDRIEGIMRENEQLRKFVGEHRHASQHMQDVGSQMQRHLSSMENRALQLRTELRP